MKKTLKTGKTTAALILMTCCIAMMISAFSPGRDDQEVPYPDGYRGWVHVKTALIEKGSPAYAHWGGFHHIYANAQAIEGYKTGKFPDGAMLVFDVLEATSKDSVVSEGKRKLIDVMVRDKRFSATGGWGYEEFQGDSKTERNIKALAEKACYSCHSYQKVNDNVFSKLRD